MSMSLIPQVVIPALVQLNAHAAWLECSRRVEERDGPKCRLGIARRPSGGNRCSGHTRLRPFHYPLTWRELWRAARGDSERLVKLATDARNVVIACEPCMDTWTASRAQAPPAPLPLAALPEMSPQSPYPPPTQNGPESGKCYACGSVKPVDAFPLDRSKSRGRKSICRKCDNEKSRRYYEANRERKLAYMARRKEYA